MKVFTIPEGNDLYRLPQFGTNIIIQHSTCLHKIMPYMYIESIAWYGIRLTEAALVDSEVNEGDIEHEPPYNDEEGVQEL